MENPFLRREIWFITGSQDLYGPETLTQVESQSKELVQILNDSANLPLSIVWQPICTERYQIREIVHRANSTPACVGVITWMHTFSPTKSWIQGLQNLQVPLLHIHTQYAERIPWSSIDMDYMNLNQSAHGDREFGYMLTRLGIPRKTVAGHVSHKHVQAEIAVWMRAAVGWDEIHNTKIVRIGDNMREVGVTEGDKTEAEIAIGVSVNTWPVNELVEEINKVTEQQVDLLVEEYQAEYAVDQALIPSGSKHESLRQAAKQEIGLQAFLETKNAKGFTDTFEDIGDIDQLPGLAVQRLMAKGYGFGAEGDWKTAVLVRLAKVMGYGLPGGASLMEDYCYDLPEGEELILGAHMLEICPTITTEKPSLEIHRLDIGGKPDPVRLKFNTDPGPAVVVALSDLRDRFRLTANIVDVVSPIQPLSSLPVACAVWKPQPNFQTSVQCWLAAGAAHHTVMSTALGIEVWQDFAKIAQMELAQIDKHTTLTQFEQALHWNNAYYRLDQRV